VVQLHEVVPLLQVRVRRRLLHGEHGGDRAAGRLALLHDLELPVLRGPLLHQRIDGVGVLGAGEHVLEHLELHPVGVAHHLGEAVPLAGLEGQHPDVTVLAGDDGGGRAQRHPHPGAPVEDAVLGVTADVLAAHEGGGDGLGAGGVHQLAASHPLPSVDRRQAPGGGAHGSEEVGGEGPVLERRLAGATAVAVARAGEVVGVQVAAGPLAVGTGLAEGRDRDDHQVRIQLLEARVVEAQLADALRGVIVDQDVGPLQQPEQQVATLRPRQVEGDAALVRIEEVEEAALLQVRLVAGEGPPAASRVS
jgi:hypothetical protein